MKKLATLLLTAGMLFGAATGVSAIFAFDGAGISANYKINDMVGLTAAWIRP